jgi:hypothetical protein
MRQEIFDNLTAAVKAAYVWSKMNSGKVFIIYAHGHYYVQDAEPELSVLQEIIAVYESGLMVKGL